jgi:hypothetical protein
MSLRTAREHSNRCYYCLPHCVKLSAVGRGSWKLVYEEDRRSSALAAPSQLFASPVEFCSVFVSPWFDGVTFVRSPSQAIQSFLLGVLPSVCCFYLWRLPFILLLLLALSLVNPLIWNGKHGCHWSVFSLLKAKHSVQQANLATSPTFLIFPVCYVSERLKIPGTMLWSSFL